jgi:hypothetical protein
MSVQGAFDHLDARPAVAIPARSAKPLLRPATIIVALGTLAILLFLVEHVLHSGYLRKDLEALQQGDAWRTGGWLAQVVLRIVGLLPEIGWQQIALSCVAAVVASLAYGVLYDRLRANGWFALGAAALIVAVGLHLGALYTITASSSALPLFIAVGALVPAIRTLEDVGDVQAAIGLSLLLPLLLLASPLTTLLIPPIALGAALADPDSRRDPRAFVAMLLVTILPTIIVAIGILGFLAKAHLDVADALVPYVNAYTHLHFGDVLGGLAALGTYAPAIIVPIAYCVWPSLPERRHVVSALAVVALPAYLGIGGVILDPTMIPLTPATAFLAVFVSWLAVARLPLSLRLAALVLLILGTVFSWLPHEFWDDPAWKAALLHFVPDGLGPLALRPGV